MTAPRITGTTAQTVHGGAGGASVRVESVFAQMLRSGITGGGVRVANATAQIVNSSAALASSVRVTHATAQTITSSIAGSARETFAIAQVIHTGDGGAMARESFATLQVIYTTGVADNTRQRAWTFDFDGHTFYVLDLGASGALVFDTATGQWSRFDTQGFGGHWDFKNGFHWRDGKAVVGGQAGTGTIHALDPDSFLDEGWRPVAYEVRGVIPTGGNENRRQYALRLFGSAGLLADGVSPVMRMQFSDDQGASWSAEHSLALVPDTRQRIEFRSLGAFTAPGRIFRIYDEGGIKFLARVEADIDGDTSS